MLLVVLTPMLPSLAASALCPMSDEAGDLVAARPPPRAFAVVWPLLFLGLGVALWRMERKTPVLFLAVLLAAWQTLYSTRCGHNKRAACWLLPLCVAATLFALFCAACQQDCVSGAALSALLAWLLFAQNLAVVELQAE